MSDRSNHRVVRDSDHRLPGVFLMVNSLETGGTERQFAALARALDRTRFAISLGSLKREGVFLKGLDELVEFSPGGSLVKWGSQRARLNLARHLALEKITIAQAFDFYANLMLIPAARVARVPAVIGSFRQLGDLLTPMQFRAQNLVFRLCDRVVCNSEAAAKQLRCAGIASRKLVIIPNGLADEFFAPASPELPRESGAVQIGMISRMNHKAKRHDIFLRMAVLLAPRFPQLRFILAGDGPLRPGLEDMAASLGLNGRVVFLGDRRDIPGVLASLDITVLPSESESLSNVILESMAGGVPVVARSVGGNGELIRDGENGLLLPNADERQFAAKVELLLTQSELRQRCATNARQQAQSKYSMASVTLRYEALYCELLAEKAGMASVEAHQELTA